MDESCVLSCFGVLMGNKSLTRIEKPLEIQKTLILIPEAGQCRRGLGGEPEMLNNVALVCQQ